MHEWGHLAHAAKFLRVADEDKPAYKKLALNWASAFVQAIAAMPDRVRAMDPATSGSAR